MNIFQKTTGEFVLKVDGEVRTYTDYNDVPKDKVQNVFKFTPDMVDATGPDGQPHTGRTRGDGCLECRVERPS